MAGGDRECEASILNGPGQVPERQHVDIERLVDVKVDANPCVGCGIEGHIDQSLAVGIEVGTASHQVRAGFDRRCKRGTIPRTGRARHRV